MKKIIILKFDLKYLYNKLTKSKILKIFIYFIKV